LAIFAAIRRAEAAAGLAPLSTFFNFETAN
jgi:hypothetical protein